jgi:hypothetical protein
LWRFTIQKSVIQGGGGGQILPELGGVSRSVQRNQAIDGNARIEQQKIDVNYC